MTLDTVLERHTAAMGGREAVEAVRAVRIDFALVEPTFTVDGVYAADRSGTMRVDIFADGVRVFSEGIHNGKAWQLHQDSERADPASPEGAQALLNGIDGQLRGLHEMGDLGYAVSYEGVEEVEGAGFHVIETRSPFGHTVRRYLNDHSFLIERSRETKALHPDVDPTEVVIETRFSDFRTPEGGVPKPFKEVQVDLGSGDVLATTTVRSVEVNPQFPPTHLDPTS